MFLTERYCPDPEPPHPNGGKYDWDSSKSGITTFNTTVTYSCDIARQFFNSSSENYTSIYEAVFPVQTKTCEWNQTYSPPEPVSLIF